MEENVVPEQNSPNPTPPPFSGSTPPPVLPPPPLYPRQGIYPQRRSSNRLPWIIIGVIVVLFFGYNFLTGITHTLRLGGAKPLHVRENGLNEIILEENGPDKLLVIDVEGVISSAPIERGGGSLVESIKEQLKLAEDDTKVKGVILKVNSPGGEVLASDDIYNLIAAFQKKTKKPVVASMGTLAASGGYYVSAPCRWIVANELTITGSIGVIMHGYNYRGLMDKIGLKPEVYKSGKFKDMLSGEKKPEEVTEEERKMVQDLINETYGRFTNIVAKGRSRESFDDKGSGKTAGTSLAKDWTDYADGRVMSGRQALDLGFVDELGNFETAVKSASNFAHVNGEPTLIQYQHPFNIGSLFKLFGKTEMEPIKVDLGLNTLKLQSGHMYFIAPIVLH
ncbi:MAG: Signal peptide peptidase SppA [Verrucomicrobiales bacterium]|nr:Signal peptide peptidase SppA [Verrucomicrobiales bacterium]MDB6131728.1 Signal peptide peptidase SppA [Verrucomicrobiales bacterium]